MDKRIFRMIDRVFTLIVLGIAFVVMGGGLVGGWLYLLKILGIK